MDRVVLLCSTVELDLNWLDQTIEKNGGWDSSVYSTLRVQEWLVPVNSISSSACVPKDEVAVLNMKARFDIDDLDFAIDVAHLRLWRLKRGLTTFVSSCSTASAL